MSEASPRPKQQAVLPPLVKSGDAGGAERKAGPALGHRLPPLVRPTPPAVELSKLELCAPRLVEVFLRDLDWEAALQTFFRTTSPLFEGFRAGCAAQGGPGPGAGRGFDVRMHAAQAEFLDAVMRILHGQFQDMGYSEEKFVAAVLAGCGEGPGGRAARKLTGFLDGLADFETFGGMMEDTFARLYGAGGASGPGPLSALLARPPGEAPGPGPGSAGRARRPATAVDPQSGAPAAGGGCVRVLWDIENVSVSKKVGGIAATAKLHEFLAAKGLFGAGIDARITAFFNPAGGAVSKHTTNELDKAAVELVWVSSKREDADRKLGMRINQEMQVLSPSATTFVIITSDQDFRHHFQLLRNAGYRVVLLHCARPGKWEQALAMHCSESYSWPRDVLGEGAAPGGEGARPGGDRGKGRSRRSGPGDAKTASAATSAMSAVPVSVAGGQWLSGICKVWKGKYGFISVNAEGSAGDVYVHASMLPLEFRGVLTPGEAVELTVEAAEKGWRAVAVRAVDGA